jgi:hypothetical protein
MIETIRWRILLAALAGWVNRYQLDVIDRIQGALQNVGHRVARSTIAKILRAHGISPVP